MNIANLFTNLFDRRIGREYHTIWASRQLLLTCSGALCVTRLFDQDGQNLSYLSEELIRRLQNLDGLRDRCRDFQSYEIWRSGQRSILTKYCDDAFRDRVSRQLQIFFALDQSKLGEQDTKIVTERSDQALGLHKRAFSALKLAYEDLDDRNLHRVCLEQAKSADLQLKALIESHFESAYRGAVELRRQSGCESKA